MIPATASNYKTAAAHLIQCANSLQGNGSLLMLFYHVECEMKSRYLLKLKKPKADTTDLGNAFGRGGHDLGKGLQMLGLAKGAPVGNPPTLKLPSTGPQPPTTIFVQDAHQLWRYDIPHTGETELWYWLQNLADWLEKNP